jgi:hypothetical protein
MCTNPSCFPPPPRSHLSIPFSLLHMSHRQASAQAIATAKKQLDRLMQFRLEAIAIFSLVWSVGAAVDGPGRILFDRMLRRLLSAAPLGDLNCVPTAPVAAAEYIGSSDGTAASVVDAGEEGGDPVPGQVRRCLVPVPDKGQTVYDYTLDIEGIVVGKLTGEGSPVARLARRGPPGAGGLVGPPGVGGAGGSGGPGSLAASAAANLPHGGVKWTEWLPSSPSHPESLAAFSIPASTPFESIVVPTLDTVRSCRMAATLAWHGFHVLAAGPTGTGKTIVMTQWLLPMLNAAAAEAAEAGLVSLHGGAAAGGPASSTVAARRLTGTGFAPGTPQKDGLGTPVKTSGGAAGAGSGVASDALATRKRFLSLLLQFTARTSAADVQAAVDASVTKRRMGVYGPSLGRRQVVIVDDLHVPAHDTYGCQPAIELLRQWMDHGGWYDRGDRSSRAFRKVRGVVDMGDWVCGCVCACEGRRRGRVHRTVAAAQCLLYAFFFRLAFVTLPLPAILPPPPPECRCLTCSLWRPWPPQVWGSRASPHATCDTLCPCPSSPMMSPPWPTCSPASFAGTWMRPSVRCVEAPALPLPSSSPPSSFCPRRCCTDDWAQPGLRLCTCMHV